MVQNVLVVICTGLSRKPGNQHNGKRLFLRRNSQQFETEQSAICRFVSEQPGFDFGAFRLPARRRIGVREGACVRKNARESARGRAQVQECAREYARARAQVRKNAQKK